jgi:hypothetical protein
MLIRSRNSVTEAVAKNETIGPRDGTEEEFFAAGEDHKSDVIDAWKRKSGMKSSFRPWAGAEGRRAYDRIFGRR